ncbi:hypothetical protein [Cecembia sp.]|uniref:hypothetical protein n=1 Tax=Cecembia sp. TaxID=1898110 RepID=UPI0025BD2C9A|nr:hypothetical protein [Cecembia sp.]
MKKYTQFAFILAAGLLFWGACSEKGDDAPRRSQQEIDDVVSVIAEELMTVNIQEGDETRAFGFRLEKDNEGDDKKETTKEDKDKRDHEKKVEQSGLFSCLNKLDLSDEQAQQIRRSFSAAVDCRKETFSSLREELVDIILDMEKRRLVLLEKLLKEEINRDEFRSGLKNILETYQNKIEEIRKKHVENIKPCLREMVSQIRTTIGEENWTQLYACIKN